MRFQRILSIEFHQISADPKTPRDVASHAVHICKISGGAAYLRCDIKCKVGCDVCDHSAIPGLILITTCVPGERKSLPASQDLWRALLMKYQLCDPTQATGIRVACDGSHNPMCGSSDVLCLLQSTLHNAWIYSQPFVPRACSALQELCYNARRDRRQIEVVDVLLEAARNKSH